MIEDNNHNQERWNVYSLKEYTDFAMTTLDEKFMTITKKDEEAVKTAKESMEHRLDNLNEFRAQLNDQTGTFLKKDIFEVSHRLIEQRVDALARLVYIGVGICIAVEVILRLIK
jgi:hypothetical protein